MHVESGNDCNKLDIYAFITVSIPTLVGYYFAEKTGKLTKSLGAKKPKSLIRIVKIAMATMVTYA
jgi:hypothetical protein